MFYVHEKSFVFVKDRGFISISDVEIGDYILSRKTKSEDSYSVVINKEGKWIDNYIKIQANNGTRIFSESSENVLTYENEYLLKDSENINCVVIPSKNSEIFEYDRNLSELAWFLGMHTGDGTCDRKLIDTKRRNYYKYRLRVLGDNENIIMRYCEFANKKLFTNVKYKLSTKKIYKSDVWEYSVCSKTVEGFVNLYFDGCFGNKTYTGNVYSTIIKNNLWIPYISGLIDSDGTIKQSGSITICMCMYNVIECLCNILSRHGIRYHVKHNLNVRKNEKPLYNLTIYLNETISKNICDHMGHESKIKKINSGNTNKFFSISLYSVGKEIFERIIGAKFKTDNIDEYKNASAIKRLLKSRNGLLGLGGLVLYKNLDIISDEEYFEIIRREPIKEISKITESAKFISLETESGNYYAGNFGLVNVKC
jgi:hypothetical protein